MATSNLRLPKSEISVDSPNRAAAMQNLLTHTSSDSILGRGTYGTVIKAVYKGKEVAVKILDNRAKPKMLTIKSEANILGWSHKNIIEIYKVDFTDSYNMVIMERFPGQCLQSVLDSIPIPVFHRILISLDISSALEHCHQHGLIHLDVKPQNVLAAFPVVRKEFHWQIKYICKLCDFGSSIKLDEVSETENRATVNMRIIFVKQKKHFLSSNISTSIKQYLNGFLRCSPKMLGTVRYMPPEALKRSKISTAADIYSLGITMWQIKSGKYPYAYIDSNQSVAYRVVKNNLRPNCKQDSKVLLTPKRSHQNCLCENFSSYQSAENSVEGFLNLNKLGTAHALQRKERRELFKDISHKFNSSGHQVERSEISQSSLNLNVRNVIKSLTPLKNSNDITKPFFENNKEIFNVNKISPVVNNTGLKSVFEMPSLIRKEKLKYADDKFENLYTKCWNNDPEKRPTSSKIKLELLNILLKLS